MNAEWEQKYQYEIPVLAKVLPDGTEVSLFNSFFYIFFMNVLSLYSSLTNSLFFFSENYLTC